MNSLRSSPPRSRRGGWLASIALVSGVVAVILATRGGGDSPHARGGRAPKKNRALPRPLDRGSDAAGEVRTAQAVQIAAAPLEPGLGAPPVPPGAKSPLATYLEFAVYPPTSRPLRLEQADLIDWNQRYERFGETAAEPAVTFLFTAERYWITGDETLHATLEVRREGKPIAVTITESLVAALDPTSGTPPTEHDRIDLAYSNVRGVYAAEFTPGAVTQLRQATLFGMFIEFDYGGPERQRASFRFAFNPDSGIPARFTGKFRDVIEHGSLIIYAEVDVVNAGYYLIDCNLWDSNEKPVAWTRYKGDLPEGKAEVPLLFFGRVLVDSQSQPPWHIGQLRGGRHIEARDPDLELMPAFDGEFTTREYTVEEFSDAEWDSEHKRKKVELLRNALQDPSAPRIWAAPGDVGSP